MTLLNTVTRQENPVAACAKLLSLANVKVSITTLEQDLYNHPDYPSLLSISDILNSYGVENITVRTTIEKLGQIPLPCIVPIKADNNEEKLAVISSIENKTLSYYEPDYMRIKTVTSDEFLSKWTSGTVMIVNGEDAKGESEYYEKRKVEKFNFAKTLALYLSYPMLVLLACITVFFNSDLRSIWLPLAYVVLTLSGMITCSLLIWYEVDQYNPLVQRICKASKKVNCGAVLNSKASKIFGVSWSAIGFTYFGGSNLLLLTTGLINVNTVVFLGCLNILAIPYIFYSVFYQWKVARQWCLLCLIVQSVLVLQAAAGILSDWETMLHISSITLSFVVSVILSFAIPAIILGIFIPSYRTFKEGRHNKMELQRLKHSAQIFDALLAKQRKIENSTQGLGIMLGNPEARHKIVKVCNPYCGPCAEAHTPIEELLHNNPDVQVQIIFTASNQIGDLSAAPVKHFLAIEEKYGSEILSRALDDWYTSPKKDYAAFSAKYDLNGELKRQDHKIDAMNRWCSGSRISFTPTFFVNDHQLPEMYSVSDLKYFFSI